MKKGFLAIILFLILVCSIGYHIQVIKKQEVLYLFCEGCA